jgi:DHA1 family tetracycline resistance protein-like MFS transporter
MNSKNAFAFIFITIVIDSTGLGIIIPSLPSLVSEVSSVSISESKTVVKRLHFNSPSFLC